MAKPKASKALDCTQLVAGLVAAHDGEVAARKQRITALRDWSKAVVGLRALSDKECEHITAQLKAAYTQKGMSEGSVKVMASQDLRFLKAYNSDAAFRAKADGVDNVKACFESGAPSGDKNSPLKKAFRAIKRAKLDNRHVELNWIAEHPEAAITLIQTHLQELSKLGAQLKAVASRSQKKAA